MHIEFTCTTASGEKIVGPIQGSGGYIGGGAAHGGCETMLKVARRTIECKTFLATEDELPDPYVYVHVNQDTWVKVPVLGTEFVAQYVD